MKSQRSKPLLFIRKGGEFPLSGTALIEILRAVLNKGKPFRFRAKGFSMSPFIKDGDVITLSQLRNGSLSVGKIVAIIHPGTDRLIVHRVVGKNGNTYLIQGDNLREEDKPILATNILGYVTKIERGGKKVFFGLGPERFLIAFLNRRRLFPSLFPKLRFVRNILFMKKSKPINE